MIAAHKFTFIVPFSMCAATSKEYFRMPLCMYLRPFLPKMTGEALKVWLLKGVVRLVLRTSWFRVDVAFFVGREMMGDM